MTKIKVMKLGQSGELVDTDSGVTTTMVEGDAREIAWQEKMDELRWYNKWCGIAHFAQFCLIFGMSYTVDTVKEFVMPVTSTFLDWSGDYPEQSLQYEKSFVFVRLASFFSLLSALAHLTVLQNWEKYESDLRKGLNRFRWWEYSLSNSLILTLLFWLWGNYDWC